MLPGGKESTVSEQAWCAAALDEAASSHPAEMGLEGRIPAPDAVKLRRFEAAGCATDEELRAAVFRRHLRAAGSSG